MTKLQYLSRTNLIGVGQNLVCNCMYGTCGYIELEVLSKYKEYLISDTGCSYGYDKAKDGTKEVKDQNQELEWV